MITTVRTRRLPVRACEATRALEQTGTPAELMELLRGTHGFEVRPDRLACQVRHSVAVERGLASRMWWVVIGRPLYNELIEDAFDDLAKAAGAAVRRPTRCAPYARLLRRVLVANPLATRGGLPRENVRLSRRITPQVGGVSAGDTAGVGG